MATKILFEIWDSKHKKCESKTSFDRVDAFLTHAMKMKEQRDKAVLRVHVPPHFELSGRSLARIERLGMMRF